MIVLGAHLNDHTNYVICWTPDGKATGGTGVGIRIANHFGIPVWNLHDPEILETVKQWIS